MSHRQLRHRTLSFRVTDDEMALLRARARECGCTLSAFARGSSLGAVPRARPNALERDAVHQLARIGNNLNQLARHANGTRRIELSRRLDEVLATVEQAVERLA